MSVGEPKTGKAGHSATAVTERFIENINDLCRMRGSKPSGSLGSAGGGLGVLTLTVVLR